MMPTSTENPIRGIIIGAVLVLILSYFPYGETGVVIAGIAKMIFTSKIFDGAMAVIAGLIPIAWIALVVWLLLRRGGRKLAGDRL